MATADKMINKIRKLGLKLPEEGTGRNGKILNSDLEYLLADYYNAQTPNDSWGWQARLALKEVMLSYRFDKLKEHRQEEIMADDKWFAEEKFDGCRMVVTYDPKEGFGFFGRNRSKATFLPINYTDKILINGQSARSFAGLFSGRAVWDAELVTDGYVETQSGSFTGAQLNAAVSVLQLNDADSHLAQNTTAPLRCILFDKVPISTDATFCLAPLEFWERRDRLEHEFVGISDKLFPFFKLSGLERTNKKAFLDSLLAQGKEGIILKSSYGLYIQGVNGFRCPDANIKVKRTMTGALGDEIDAYIIGYTNGEEWDKRGMIAGITLAVQLRDEYGKVKPHWIATVSGIPDSVREKLSYVDGSGAARMNEEYYQQVLTIDGQDISSRNRRIAHAKADWNKGFRTDKLAQDCIMDETFIDSQMF